MTEMTVPVPEPQPSFWQLLHHHFAGFTSAAVHFLPRLERIALDPGLDAAVEALLAAADAGVGAGVLKTTLDGLRGAVEAERAQPAREQPDVVIHPAQAPQPAPAAPSFTPADGTGAQDTQTASPVVA